MGGLPPSMSINDVNAFDGSAERSLRVSAPPRELRLLLNG